MLKLAVVFENAAGKPHRWSFNEPDRSKSPEEIRAALEAMTTLHLFEKDGIRQFCKVVSAKFVETIETPLFDLSKPAPEAYVADPNNIFAAQIVSEEVEQVPVVEEAIAEEVVETAEAAAPVVDEAVEETTAEVVEEEKTEAVAPKTEKAAKTTGAPFPTPLVDQETLATMIEKAQPSIIPSLCRQELDPFINQSETAEAEESTSQKPVNPRKEQIDRLRAYHEDNKKKKKRKRKGKKKKR